MRFHGENGRCVPEAAMGALEENLSALSQTGVPAYHSVRSPGSLARNSSILGDHMLK